MLRLFLLLFMNVPAAAEEQIAIDQIQRAALGIAVGHPIAVAEKWGKPLPAEVTVPNAQLRIVTAPQHGLIEVLLVAEGEEIHANQPLVRIQSPRLLELQSDYLEAYTRFNLAKSNYRRDEQLSEEGIIAERRLLESKAHYDELSMMVVRSRHILELAGMDERALDALARRRELSSTLTVHSPMDGGVLEQLATAGDRVDAADPLYRVAQLNPLWLEIHVPLENLAGTAPGQTVTVPAFGLSGRVITVGRMVHGADQGVMVRAEISEGVAALRPGQFVQAQLASASQAQSFRVPRSAVVRSQGDSYVFAASPGGFTPISVAIAAEEPQHFVVTADLSTEHEIAVSGAVAIKAAWLTGAE